MGGRGGTGGTGGTGARGALAGSGGIGAIGGTGGGECPPTPNPLPRPSPPRLPRALLAPRGLAAGDVAVGQRLVPLGDHLGAVGRSLHDPSRRHAPAEERSHRGSHVAGEVLRPTLPCLGLRVRILGRREVEI